MMNVGAGLLTAVLLAGTALGLNARRNSRLERILKDGLSRHGVGRNPEDFHVIFENKCPVSVRVRTIVIVGEHQIAELRYRRPVSQATLFNALGQDRSPPRISIRAHFPAKPDHDDIQVLLPYSGGLWGITIHELRQRALDVTDCWTIVEYPTIFGGSALLRIHFDESTVALVGKKVCEIRQETSN